MHRTIEYALLFIALVILQVFLFSRVGVSVYLHPLLYIAFIILLPMEISGVSLLLLGALLGVTMDLLLGMPGVNTITTVFIAFVRPYLLDLLLGKDEVRDGGVPNVNRLGIKRFFRYTVFVVVLHGLIFFTLESLNWKFYHWTLLRVGLSSLVTVGLIYLTQRWFVINR